MTPPACFKYDRTSLLRIDGETDMEVRGGCWIAEKGDLVDEKAAVGVKIEEILFDESEGLAGAGALGGPGEGGTYFGFALAMFSESGASVQAKACPVENRCCATEERLAIMHGGGGHSFVQKFENGAGEGFLLFLGFAPVALSDGDWVCEQRMRAGGGAGKGETAGLDGLAEQSLQPKGC